MSACRNGYREPTESLQKTWLWVKNRGWYPCHCTINSSNNNYSNSNNNNRRLIFPDLFWSPYGRLVQSTRQACTVRVLVILVLSICFIRLLLLAIQRVLSDQCTVVMEALEGR